MTNKRSPREIPPFTKPDVFRLFSDGKVDIAFLEYEPHFFFLGFPREGHTIPIEVDEIPEIVEVLLDIANRVVSTIDEE